MRPKTTIFVSIKWMLKDCTYFDDEKSCWIRINSSFKGFICWHVPFAVFVFV